MRKPISRSPTGQVNTDKAIEPIREALNGLLQEKALNASILDQVTLPNMTLVRFQHGLGRAYTGYEIVRFRGSGPTGYLSAGYIEEVLSSGNETCDRSKELWLQTTGYGNDIIVTIRVF